MTNNLTSGRRRHSAALKAQVLTECERPGASIAAVALAHGLNANLVHKWRARAQGHRPHHSPAVTEAFVPLPVVPSAAIPAHTDLRIELRRGPVTVTLSWPLSAAADCAIWLREVLR
jgi:transposase